VKAIFGKNSLPFWHWLIYDIKVGHEALAKCPQLNGLKIVIFIDLFYFLLSKSTENFG